MATRRLSTLLTIFFSILLLSADQNASPSPGPLEQRIFLTGGEVKALNIAYGNFLTSNETAGSSVPLGELRVNIRQLSDGYHVDFECYPNQGTSWTYQYIVNSTNFQIRLVGKGTAIFRN
jgi:hypothetical protein